MTIHQRQVHAVIIGAGIIGCSASYFLERHGIQTLVLDSGGIGGQGSGANAGTLAVQNKEGVLLQLALESVDLWKELAESHSLMAEYSRSGGLRVATTADEVAELEYQLPRQRALGLPVELMTARQLQTAFMERFGEVLAAAYCPIDGSANPRLAIRSLARLAELQGAEFMTHTRVIDLEAVSDSQINVFAQDRLGQRWKISSTFVINAAGVWSPDIAAMLDHRIPLILKVQQAMVTARTSPIMTRSITHIGERLSLKQVRDGHILIGGGWPGKTDDAKVKREILLSSMFMNLELAVKVMPEIANLPLLRSWCGLEGETVDRLPAIGSMGYPSHFLMAVSGYGGFTVGPLIGKLIAERIVLDQEPRFYDDCNPLRLLDNDPITQRS